MYEAFCDSRGSCVMSDKVMLFEAESVVCEHYRFKNKNKSGSVEIEKCHLTRDL